MRWKQLSAIFVALAIVLSAFTAVAQQQPPNILVIMGDDIGYWNISAYNRGQMGYRTPNIDRIANEGAILTDYYGQQSCTAGRRVHHRSEPDAHWHAQSRAAGGERGIVGEGPDTR
jgi:hypothetical protein